MKLPRVMLAKVAEARALRRAFPADLSGVYAPEEMAQSDVDAEVVSVETVRKAEYPDTRQKLDTRRLTDRHAQQLAIQVKQLTGFDDERRYDLAQDALGRLDTLTTFKGLEVWEAQRIKQYAQKIGADQEKREMLYG